ncbi:MAG: ASPIC/UnbV domain-containing protein [Cyclobacteriaceae bacterium]|nr:ASPIC/UnbV domain-containing protein [Cyclobacteriaceae bacterium]MDH4296657.1 ASPIC/UnbV domain-containing protein [Cyclobacteriaceae bacterium]MDH5247666.1 ASPIC/UnbV domain-containing protein [Cyclobacteriaceae bacterium]
MIREIDGGSSHLSQNSTIAHFGLGTATSVDAVILKWIGGKEQVLTNQKVNTLLTITEVAGREDNQKRFLAWIVVPHVIFMLYGLFKRNLNRRSGTKPSEPGSN